MDGSRFDRLTRVLASRPHRRGVVRALAGALVGTAGLSRQTAGAHTCLALGQPCATAAVSCCGDAFCVNGGCRRFVSPGELCTSDEECSPSQSSSYFCRENGMALSPACCGFEQAGCGNDSHCCANLVCTAGVCTTAPVSIFGGVPCWRDEECGWPLFCDDNGTYSDGPLHCCLPAGGWCLQHADCCGVSLCVDGYCA